MDWKMPSSVSSSASIAGSEKPFTEFLSFGCSLGYLPPFKDIWSTMDYFGPLKKTISVGFKSDVQMCLDLGLKFRLTFERRTDYNYSNRSNINIIIITVDIVQGNDCSDKSLTFINAEKLRSSISEPLKPKNEESPWSYAIEFKEYDWPTSSNVHNIRINARVDVQSQEDHRSHVWDPTSFLLSDTLSEVTIQCGDDTFPAHVLILAGVSPVFMKMFTIDMKEKKEKVIEMKDVSPDVVKIMLRFIYTGSIEIKPDVGDPAASPVSFIQEIYENAAMYELVGLKVACAKKLESMISLDNVVDMYKWTLLHEVTNLQAVTFKFIADNKEAFLNQHPLRDVIDVCPQIIERLLRS